jgi:hypothetical protein
MPFKVVKVEGSYRIINTQTGELTKPKFKTKQAAQTQVKNWDKYRQMIADSKP